MRFLSSLLCILLFSVSVFSNNPKYCESQDYFTVAASITWPQTPLQYLNQVPDETGALKDYFIYHNRPTDDLILEVPKRPHIMGVHGGIPGLESIFALGYSWQLGDAFTKYGYGSSSIEFRSYVLGLGTVDLCSDEFITEGIKTFYRSIHDTRAAINYLFDNSKELGIDTSYFFLYGNSLGATSILQAALVKDEMEWLSKFPEYQDLILNDPQFTPWPPQRKIAGIISIAGNIQDLDFLDEEDNVPLFMGHGVCDLITPFGEDNALDCELAPIVYGPEAILSKAIETETPLSIHAINNLGHGWPEGFNTSFFNVIRDWMKNQILCGTPVLECTIYDDEIDPEFYFDCPKTDICDLISSDISESATSLELNIFPNPGTDEINIAKNLSTHENIFVEVYDINGEQIVTRKKTENSCTIDMSNVPSGVYYLKFTSGNIVQTKAWVNIKN